MHFIEEQIRQILVKAIKKQSKENGVNETETQVQFIPFLDGDEILCRYALLIDYKVKKELSFTSIAGAINTLLKPSIEGYLKQLYREINHKEGIEIADIRILILATKNNTSINDLQAYLYNKGSLIRELKVSEFVG